MNLIVFLIAAFASYWEETELFLFLGGLFIMGRFLYRWYSPLGSVWPEQRGQRARLVLRWLPAVALAIIWGTLLTMASFDVVGIWVIFYIVLGYVWLDLGVFLMEYLLDFFVVCDAVYLENQAAIFSSAGGFLGITLIYAGANVGDGPGWWVVFIAGGLGLAAWFLLARLINAATDVSERITVDRDIGCGVRFGMYLFASGLILARASSGDWTSFSATLVEFLVGWPVLPLAIMAVFVERHYARYTPLEYGKDNLIVASACWGIIYLMYAAIVLMLPLVLNAAPLTGIWEVLSWMF